MVPYLHTMETSSITTCTIVQEFDKLAFRIGDQDVIANTCYTEIQFASQVLARQLYWRFRSPDIVLLDLQNHAVAELVAVLACMRLGALFCPVNVLEDSMSLPKKIRVLRDSETKPRVAAVVCAQNDQDPILVPFLVNGVHFILYLNESGDLLHSMSVPDSIPSAKTVGQDDDLYILFTSGSTNSPKAVIGSHTQTLRRLRWFADTFQPSMIIRRTPLIFVDGLHELLSVCVAGALHLLPPNQTIPQAMVQTDVSCSTITLLPSQLRQVLDTISEPCQVPHVIVSGEACPAALLRDIGASPHFHATRLYNLYGQTETTGDCCFTELMIHDEKAQPAIVDYVTPVGRPRPGVTISNINDTKELVVAGCLSNGYYQRSSWNAESFSTGDIGFCQDGVWYVRGRRDHMEKINGVWVVPEAVEDSLAEVFDVSCLAVIVDHVLYAATETPIAFSRQRMRDMDIPFHLIPRRLFQVASIPRTGSGKVSRTKLEDLIRERLANSGSDSSVGTFSGPVATLLSEVLSVPLSRVDSSMSFVDLGGDSALAVTVWHKLKTLRLLQADVFPEDILVTTTIEALLELISGTVPSARKRPRASKNDFQPRLPIPVPISVINFGLEFDACVDSKPLVVDRYIYGASQGGVVQRFALDADSARDPDCYQMQGNWKIQASLVRLEDDLVLVCGYDPDDEKGVVVALSADLSSIQWQVETSGMVKSEPVVLNSMVHVHAGSNLLTVNCVDGNVQTIYKLQGPSESKPVVLEDRNGQWVAIYAFSEWDLGVEIRRLDSPKTTILAEICAPVYADLVVVGPHTAVAVDSLGFAHRINVTDKTVDSFKVATAPIFSNPVCANDGVVFGCHDGMVRCLKASDLATTLWTFNALAVVYAGPLVIDDAVAICTTAGDVFRIVSGTETARAHAPGEIWSDPVFIPGDKAVFRVAFGARDSKLHVMEL